jgi:hypothetical protein
MEIKALKEIKAMKEIQERCLNCGGKLYIKKT